MKPRVFVGSSREGLHLAEAVQRLLEHDTYCTTWTQGIFTAGGVAMADLLSAVRDNDFGIFVCTADDVTKSRSSESPSPRDNVLLEAGMFLGRYGIGHSFIIAPRDIPDFRLPSDFRGITVADYESDRLRRVTPDTALGAACSKIKEKIRAMPNPAAGLKVSVSHQIQNQNYTFPSKIFVDIDNNSRSDVVLKTKFFRYGKGLRPSPKANPMTHGETPTHQLRFMGSQNIHDRDSVLLSVGDRANCYVPIDPTESEGAVQAAITAKSIAELYITAYWIGENPSMQNLVINI
jgi:hypothetical protein